MLKGLLSFLFALIIIWFTPLLLLWAAVIFCSLIIALISLTLESNYLLYLVLSYMASVNPDLIPNLILLVLCWFLPVAIWVFYETSSSQAPSQQRLRLMLLASLQALLIYLLMW